MKTLHLFLIISALLLANCKNESEDELTPQLISNEKISELDWLNDMANDLTDCTCMVTIFEGTYNEEIVFFRIMNDPLCNSVFGTALHDSTGAIIKQYNNEELEAFGNEVQIIDTLYTCQEIPACNVNDPLTELDWLAEMNEELNNQSIYPVAFVKAKYKEKIVFYYEYICPACNFVFSVTLCDCEGKVVRTYDRDDREKFEAEVQIIEYL